MLGIEMVTVDFGPFDGPGVQLHSIVSFLPHAWSCNRECNLQSGKNNRFLSNILNNMHAIISLDL